MRIRLFVGALALIVATVVVTTAMILPQDEEKAGGATSQDEEMMAWMEANKLNDHHKEMASYAGKWIAHNTHYNPDGSVMSKTVDSSTNELILGGRFVLQNYKGKFGEMPFEGMGVMGFDTMTNEWVHVWFDNFTTAPMVSRGKPGKDPKVVTTVSEMKDPASGQVMKMEMVSTTVSADEHKLDMFVVSPEGKFKNMQITYKRKQ